MGGVVGLVLALILETVLFISRTSLTPGLGKKYEAFQDPKRYAQKKQKAVPVPGEAFRTIPGRAEITRTVTSTSCAEIIEPKKER
jgi:hypothetical protein